ncbi:MBL fold metallo-hydrolase [Sulfobacillus harzensis]|nr:MBL fold metallo-hydrolase [Sulfobacillus harzensis]
MEVDQLVWNYGRKGEPPIQVLWIGHHTVILRQSKRTSYEAPFLYLLFGSVRAILFDTGATRDPARFPLRETVDDLMASWLSSHPHAEPYELIVAHTHAHGDHVAGDAQFHDRAHTTIVPHSPEDVAKFFGLTSWPEGRALFDLGGRILTVFPIPGHQKASIAVYDPDTEFLLTGDTVYPGRLYVQDSEAFRQSLERLSAFVDAVPISRVMGCHIEMTRTAGRDFPIGATYQPREAPLPMTSRDLKEVAQAAKESLNKRGVHRRDRFIIYQGQPMGALLVHAVRLLLSRVTSPERS